jgi:hypothetical protein
MSQEAVGEPLPRAAFCPLMSSNAGSTVSCDVFDARSHHGVPCGLIDVGPLLAADCTVQLSFSANETKMTQAVLRTPCERSSNDDLSTCRAIRTAHHVAL